jgi:hypothetical protein
MQTMDDEDSPPGPDGGSGATNDWTSTYDPHPYTSNDLWLELTNIDFENHVATPRLHGTVDYDSYQLLSHTNLAQPFKDWIPGEIVYGAIGTNQTDFQPVPISQPSVMFYRAHHANPVVSVSRDQDAFEPYPPSDPGQIGILYVNGENLTSDLTVRYTVSGSATAGVDYTSLSGTVVLSAGGGPGEIQVQPLYDGINEPDETVTVTLTPETNYLIRPDAPSATISIKDFSTTVDIMSGSDATEPDLSTSTPGQTGFFWVDRVDERNQYLPLTVQYVVSGTASNGVDYTNLTGTVTFAADEHTTYIFVEPLADNLFEGDETVTVTLLTNNYFCDSNQFKATILLHDAIPTNIFEKVADLPGPIGIDYHVPSDSLIVSYNYNSGEPYDFARISTTIVMSNSIPITNVVITNWSGVHGLGDEVKLATVHADSAGFTNGDMYFASGYGIGWLSASGSVSNLNWCTLTNNTVTNALPLRGSLYVDRTGTFGDNLIAVTSDPTTSYSSKGVWSVDSHGATVLLANLNTPHLEGVITLTNYVQQWGPWAGKVITGDEDQTPNPVIYAIAPNGDATTFDTTTLIPEGIRPEDFDIIPANQDLYACDPERNIIVKLSASYLTNFVGALMITDAGEGSPPAKLFIVRWDADTTNFITTRIIYQRPDGSNGTFEHVTFAPIHLPAR